MIFSIVVDMVVHAVLEEVYIMREVQNGMEWETGRGIFLFTRMTEGYWGGITSGCKTP